MPKEFDTIVVGGGLSGLIAAIVSSRRGKKTAILTKGAGTLVIGGGVIDLLGYIGNRAIHFPYDAIGKLPYEHPYKILGVERVKEAMDFFKLLTAERGYPYISQSDDSLSRLVTVIGTMKPSFLRPPSMNPESLNAEHIAVLGIEGLKDFFPELLARGLSGAKKITILEIPYINKPERDLSVLDIAQFTDKPEGKAWLLKALKGKITKGSTLIIPPILGTKPDSSLHKQIVAELGISVLETSVIPPCVTGLRLRQLLMQEVKALGIEYIEMAEVVRADVEAKRCKAIYTSAADKERAYSADNFIIATGGFFGGGLIAAPGKAWESIFKIDLGAAAMQEDWTHEELFSQAAQPYALLGVKTDESLRPVNIGGEILLENVRFCGRTLAGYDPVSEKSGNGVALSTGYAAGEAK